MSRHLMLAVLLSSLLPAARAGEAWQPVFEDASVRVAIDTASLSRENQTVIFRVREIPLKPEFDQASMRRIQEVQYRRQADCAGRALSVLSRAVFSERGSLMSYEASRPSSAKWEAPQSDKDFKLIETVCGPA